MAAVYPAGPEPMTMTLRVVPIPSPPPFRCAPGSGRCASYLEDFGEVREVADLVARRCDPRRERHAVRIDPRGVHADLLRPEHVDLGAVADEERLAGSNPETAERLVEDRALGLPPADGVGDDDRAEKAGDALALENVHGGRRVVDRAQPLGLAPALDERLVTRLEGDPGGVSAEDRVEVARRGTHRPPAHLDLGHPVTIETDQRVEEVEEDRGVGHQSGFRPAYPSSRSCQWRISRSPYFQQRLTSRPSRRWGKSIRPSPRSFGVPPRSTTFSSSLRTRSVSCSIRPVSARH